MNILLVVDNLFVSGGTQKTTLKTCLGMQELGHNVDILTFGKDINKCYPDIIGKVKIFSILNKKILFLNKIVNSKNYLCILFKAFFLGLIINLFFQDKDSIILEDEIGVLSLFFVYRRNKKVLWYLNNQFPNYISDVLIPRNSYRKVSFNLLFNNSVNILKGFYYRFCFSKISLFLTYDKNNKNKLKKVGIRNVKVVVPGVDFIPDLFLPRKRIKTINALSIGVLFPYRRYEDIFEAVAIVSRYRPNLIGHISIVGRSDLCPEYFNSLKILVNKLDISEKVSFFDYLSEDELNDVYFRSNLFVFVNDENTWGLAVAEAVMHGLPVLITNNIGISEVLSERECYKVDPKKPEQIARTFLEIFDNQTEIYNREVAAYKKVRLLTWNRFVKKIDLLLRSL